jgi:hypothetical protein
MVLVNNFKEAVKSLENMLEIDEFAILEGAKVKFSTMDKKIAQKTIVAILNSYRSVGLDIELQELEIIDTNKAIKIYLSKDKAAIIKLKDSSLTIDELLLKKVKTVFNFM